MKTIKFFTTFRNLSLEEKVEEFILLPGINISNDDEVRKTYLTEEVQYLIGAIEAQHLFEANNFVFSEFDEQTFNHDNYELMLQTFLIWVQSLFNHAWVIKDHSLACENAYLLIYEDGQLQACHSNYLAKKYTFSDCRVERIEMSLNDLKKWECLHDNIERYLYDNDSGSLSFLLDKNHCRSGKALKFIEVARQANNIGFKIASYVSAMEALFATSNSELSYRLSERMAFVLSAHGYKKIDVFNNVKLAYEIRSKLVHGDHLSQNKIEKASEVSVLCDQYLRNIIELSYGAENFKEIIDVSNQKLDGYFKQLIFE